MTTIALKKYLVSKINLLDDQIVLEKLIKIVDENAYAISDYHLNRLEESKKQFAEGNFFSQEEVDLEIEKWLKEQ